MTTSFIPFNYKVWEERKWLKLLYHNFEKGGGFQNQNEALYSSNANRYSVLKKLNNKMKYGKKYEFLLEYRKYRIHWLQSDNPITLDENNVGTNNVRGFKLLNPPNEKFPGFRGLALSTIKYEKVISTFLNGNVGSRGFYFAVGMYKCAEGGWGTLAIPGNNSQEQELGLWVRVSFNEEKFNYKRKDNFILIMSMPFIIINS